MQIQIRLFAALREATGTSAIALTLPQAATVAEAWQILQRDYPQLQTAGRPAYAVNRHYADPDQQLSEGDELALIPPVSGG